MSIDYGSKNRLGFIKLICKIDKDLLDAYILFSVIDELLVLDNDVPILIENKGLISTELVAIQKHLNEIRIAMAEDKHGRIRQ